MHTHLYKKVLSIGILSISLLLGVALLLWSTPETAAHSTYFDWGDWYPVNRGQQPGQRAINLWKDSSTTNFSGQSTYRYRSTPPGLPSSYGGQSLTYYLQWYCVSAPTDCQKLGTDWVEVLTTRKSGGEEIFLDLWAGGNQYRYKIHYRPDAFGEACDKNTVLNTPLSWRSGTGKKAPLVWQMRKAAGTTHTSNIVCAVAIKDYDYNKVRGAFYSWVKVETAKITENGNVIEAVNYYYDSAHPDRKCLTGADAHTDTRDGITACRVGKEIYWMRKLGAPEPGWPNRPAVNPLLTNGFGALQYTNVSPQLIVDRNGQMWCLDTMPSNWESIFDAGSGFRTCARNVPTK